MDATILGNLRRMINAVEHERQAIEVYIFARGRSGHEILRRHECTQERRELAQSHQELGLLLQKHKPDLDSWQSFLAHEFDRRRQGSDAAKKTTRKKITAKKKVTTNSDRWQTSFVDAFGRLQRWHAARTPLPDLLDIREDQQFVGTAARAMDREVSELEAELPDEVLANLGTPITATGHLVLNVIRDHPEGIMGEAIIREVEHRGGPTISFPNLRKYIIPELKKMSGVTNRPGVGYYVLM